MRKLDLYVDGSFDKKDEGITKASAIVLEEEKPLCCQRYLVTNKAFTDMWNIGGELIAVISGLQLCLNCLDITQPGIITVYYDYIGIEKFAKGEWKPKNVAVDAYLKSYKEIKAKVPYVDIVFRKVKAHSGNKWNEAADKIAKGIIPAECALTMLQEIRI